MPNTKSLNIAWSETGETIYCVVSRQADDYLLDDADGAFAAAPADPYLACVEDAVIKGLYAKSEARQVWDDGLYLFVFYKQAGDDPSPVNDTVIGAGEMYVADDAEVTLNASLAGIQIPNVVFPVMQGSVYTAVAVQNREVTIVRGDTPRIYFDLGADYTGYTAWFGAKTLAGDTAYVITPKECVWTSAANGQGYAALTAAEATPAGRLYAEVELRNGAQRLTAVRFRLIILEDVIDG